MSDPRPPTENAAATRPAVPNTEEGTFPLDTIILANAAVYGAFFGGVILFLVAEGWSGHPFPVVLAFVVSVILQLLAVAAVLVRRRAERRVGLGVRFADRFRWLDRPDEEEAHDAAVLPRLPRRIASLRLLALALQVTSFALFPVTRGWFLALMVLSLAAPFAREAERLRRSRAAARPPAPEVTPSGASPGSR
ncbi:MAG TPA: hypothetical protein VND21_11430 [Planctomycetota bacterium]|jgi:hypothetical protein|nr:hypothetical protein [Planctomycetota bacterium]